MSGALTAIRDFWNQRAVLGTTAGTQDLILKHLEQRAILAEIGPVAPPSMLEIGCGTGALARAIGAIYPASAVLAIDQSAPMIAEARGNLQTIQYINVHFEVGDALTLPDGPFDLVVTERCLINLPSWEMQKCAIDRIASRLTKGGRYLMCEHSQDGLNAINYVRTAWDRPAITPPWHNRYLCWDELATVTSLRLIHEVPFSATYYFLSRILNDKLAEAEGLEPRYDAKINQLALRLSAQCVDPGFAQGRLWVWEKP